MLRRARTSSGSRMRSRTELMSVNCSPMSPPSCSGSHETESSRQTLLRRFGPRSSRAGRECLLPQSPSATEAPSRRNVPRTRGEGPRAKRDLSRPGIAGSAEVAPGAVVLQTTCSDVAQALCIAGLPRSSPRAACDRLAILVLFRERHRARIRERYTPKCQLTLSASLDDQLSPNLL
jgi:hypothetical protein